MNATIGHIKDYLLLKNNEELAQILKTKESRIKYLSSKSGNSAKFKTDELHILVCDHFFNKDWLITGVGEMINEKAKRNHQFLRELNKLSIERQEYYYLTIRAENLSGK